MVCDVGGMHNFRSDVYKMAFLLVCAFCEIYSMRHHHSYVQCWLELWNFSFINNATTLKRKVKEPNSTSPYGDGTRKGCSYKSLYGAKILRKSYTIWRQKAKKHNIESRTNAILVPSVVMHKSSFIFKNVSEVKNLRLQRIT